MKVLVTGGPERREHPRDLRRLPGEHAHVVTGGEQRRDGVRADEPGAAGDEDLHA